MARSIRLGLLALSLLLSEAAEEAGAAAKKAAKAAKKEPAAKAAPNLESLRLGGSVMTDDVLSGLSAMMREERGGGEREEGERRAHAELLRWSELLRASELLRSSELLRVSDQLLRVSEKKNTHKNTQTLPDKAACTATRTASQQTPCARGSRWRARRPPRSRTTTTDGRHR